MSDYSTAALIANISRRASIPVNQGLFEDADILALATDEMHTNVVPFVMSVSEDYFVAYEDFAVGDYKTGKETRIPIPSRAVGGKLTDVAEVTPDGYIRNLPRLDLEDVERNVLTGFRIEGNDVVLWDTTATTVRFYFYRRPADLCTVEAAGKVVTVGNDDTVILESSAPFSVGDVVDIVSPKQPFQTKATVTVLGVTATTVLLSSNADVEVGDFIAPEGEAPVPQLPVEFHKYLAQATAVKCLESMNDANALKNAQGKLEELRKALVHVINPRIDGAPKKISPRGLWG